MRAIAARLAGPEPDRTGSGRNGLLFRADLCRSRGASEPALGHRQDAHPVRASEVAAGPGRGREPAMTSSRNVGPCDWIERVCAYAMQTLPPSDVAAIETHIYACTQCQRELQTLR